MLAGAGRSVAQQERGRGSLLFHLCSGRARGTGEGSGGRPAAPLLLHLCSSAGEREICSYGASRC